MIQEKVDNKTKNGRYIFEKINGYKIEIGQVDIERCPNACHINIGMWVKPNQMSLNEAMLRFEKTFKYMNRSILHNLFNELKKPKNAIINLDWSLTESEAVNNKFTFFDIEVTLFFEDTVTLKKSDDNNLIDVLLLYGSVIIDILEENQDISIKVSKKGN